MRPFHLVTLDFLKKHKKFVSKFSLETEAVIQNQQYIGVGFGETYNPSLIYIYKMYREM